MNDANTTRQHSLNEATLQSFLFSLPLSLSRFCFSSVQHLFPVLFTTFSRPCCCLLCQLLLSIFSCLRLCESFFRSYFYIDRHTIRSRSCVRNISVIVVHPFIDIKRKRKKHSATKRRRREKESMNSTEDKNEEY